MPLTLKKKSFIKKIKEKIMNVAIINHKGGVGKTFLAVHIAFYYSENYTKLVLVDFDGQRNAMQLYSGYC